jgi:hypothetical protein
MCQIEKEFLAEECGVDESHVYNSMSEKSDILELLYNSDLDDLEYCDLTIRVSTLVHDRLFIACNKTNLSVDSFLSVAIVRALHDYEQYSNSVKDQHVI